MKQNKLIYTAEEIIKSRCSGEAHIPARQFLDADEVKKVIEELSHKKGEKDWVYLVSPTDLKKRLGL